MKCKWWVPLSEMSCKESTRRMSQPSRSQDSTSDLIGVAINDILVQATKWRVIGQRKALLNRRAGPLTNHKTCCKGATEHRHEVSDIHSHDCNHSAK